MAHDNIWCMSDKDTADFFKNNKHPGSLIKFLQQVQLNRKMVFGMPLQAEPTLHVLECLIFRLLKMQIPLIIFLIQILNERENGMPDFFLLNYFIKFICYMPLLIIFRFFHLLIITDTLRI